MTGYGAGAGAYTGPGAAVVGTSAVGFAPAAEAMEVLEFVVAAVVVVVVVAAAAGSGASSVRCATAVDAFSPCKQSVSFVSVLDHKHTTDQKRTSAHTFAAASAMSRYSSEFGLTRFSASAISAHVTPCSIRVWKAE